MSSSKSSRYIFFAVFLTILFAISLNYIVKTPNDGVLYHSSAEYFYNNGLFVDPTRTFGDYLRPIPTPQIGIILYIISLKFIFKSFWLIAYAIIFAALWTVLLNRLIYFAKKNFSKRSYVYAFFPLLIFLNYDYLVSSSSFYNEALYYPFLIFAFLKIINCIQKQKSIFSNSYLFVLFLAVAVVFRIQHFTILGSLGLFFLIYNKKKEFCYTCLITIINVSIFIFLLNYLKEYDSYPPTSLEAQKTPLNYVIHLIQTQINNLNFFSTDIRLDNTYILYKNLKVHFSLYLNFLNLPKIIDFHIPDHFTKITEIIYGISALVILAFITFDFKKTLKNKAKVFLFIYFIVTSIFLFVLTDYTTRYFMFTNFCVVFYLFDFMKRFNIRLNFKKFSIIIVFFISIILYYGYGYFTNMNRYTDVYRLGNIIKEFKFNRAGYFDKNDLIISKYRYNIYWILKKPSIRMDQVIASNLIQDGKRFFFIGDIKELNEYPVFLSKIKRFENYTYIPLENNSISNNTSGLNVWRIYFDNGK